jgi:hypothetical protein
LVAGLGLIAGLAGRAFFYQRIDEIKTDADHELYKIQKDLNGIKSII